MQLIDTHTHIYLPEFDNDRDEAIERAVNAGVVKLLMPNIDSASIDMMLAAESRYPGICHPMIGLHPTSVTENYLEELETIEIAASSRKFFAVGEIGIDLYWDKTHLSQQIEAFKRQVAMAIAASLPVVIHSRDSFPEVFRALEEFRDSGLKGVFHAFTGTPDDAAKAINMGFKIGIGGIVTFKNSELPGIVKEAGPDNIILETDSPYLAPVPYRGKRNESSYICLVNDRVADILGITREESAAFTYMNSVQLFGL